jgi:hypothetical protein
MPSELLVNSGYLTAAYAVAGVIYLGYAIALVRWAGKLRR